jgi:hypothetical protein
MYNGAGILAPDLHHAGDPAFFPYDLVEYARHTAAVRINNGQAYSV